MSEDPSRSLTEGSYSMAQCHRGRRSDLALKSVRKIMDESGFDSVDTPHSRMHGPRFRCRIFPKRRHLSSSSSRINHFATFAMHYVWRTDKGT